MTYTGTHMLDSWGRGAARGRAAGLGVLVVLALLVLAAGARADTERRVTAEGHCAVEGLTARQAQRLALRQARSRAVEMAAGVEVAASTLVTDGRLAADFIKTLTRGCIVRETVTWLPVGQYQPDASRPPIVEYRVRLEATVRAPEARPRLGLDAALNQSVFRSKREKLVISLGTTTAAQVAVFDIMADDRVVMLYPDAGNPLLATRPGQRLVLPPGEGDALLPGVLPGDKRDTEAILVAAAPRDAGFAWGDVFVPDEPLPLAAFFARYADLASRCEDVVLPYEVFTE